MSRKSDLLWLCTAKKLLIDRSVNSLEHSGRTLLEHLEGTERLLDAWKQPKAIRLAGLFHSCYSTEFFSHALFDMNERRPVVELIGIFAEQVAYLFCTIDRRSFIRKLAEHRTIPIEGITTINRHGEPLNVRPKECAALLVVEMANHLEQMGLNGAETGLSYICRLSQIGKLFFEGNPPKFDGCSQGLDKESDEESVNTYNVSSMLGYQRKADRMRLLAFAAEKNPWVGEIRIALAAEYLLVSKWFEAEREASDAISLLCQMGGAWDKKRSPECWIKMAQTIRLRAVYEMGEQNEKQ